jgi:hypothetical protein
MSIKKSNDLTGNLTRDLPACRILPQATTLYVNNYMEGIVINDEQQWSTRTENDIDFSLFFYSEF